MRFTVKYFDYVHQLSVTATAPKRLPRAGDILRVRIPFATPAEDYDTGDLLVVLGRTRNRQFGWWNTLGNLRVRGKNGKITPWSSVELAINDGTLEYLN